ncbi:hypothetical protein BGZ99_002683 [Dissophora globulifera]|uniref:G-protein coupled receptors family 2 profile 2 domain-containing protein n=1 Tax=Dissophora globulifera TaxID=979702 RepID=A0A9P6UHR6_9FUNG|nr:hypothetical protein BGZ99_002683 [Dissophora globulifera]
MAQTPQKAATMTRLLCVALFVLLQSFIPTGASEPTTAATTFPVPSATSSLILPQPTSSTGNTAGNSTIAASCPPPLIPNVFNLTGGSCLGSCCVPCPVSLAFYEPSSLSDSYTRTSAVRAASSVSAAIIFICYLILPSRRKHPHLIILVISAVTIPWTGVGTAWLFKKEGLLCKSPYEIASISNSWLCGMQGTLMLYMALALTCLCFLLIVNLYVLTIYRSFFIQRYMTKLIILSLFFPLSLVIPAVSRKQIESPGIGSVCFVTSDAYFVYPLLISICLGVVLYSVTIFCMIRLQIRANSGSSVTDSTSSDPDDSQQQRDKPMSNKQRRLQTSHDISLLIQQQWRPAFFTTCLSVLSMTYGFYRLFQVTKLENIGPTTTWFINWIECLEQQAVISMQFGQLSSMPTAEQLKAAGDAAQKVCAAVAAPYVPLFSWSILADIMPAFPGIVLLIVFGSKMELWSDIWRMFLGHKGETGFTMG